MNPKKIILFLVFIVLTRVCGAQLTDNFSDNDFANNPTWTGDISKFMVNAGKLKLQAPAVSESGFMSTPSLAIHNGSWEFYLQMDFTPSSTNYAKVYLVSDQSNLGGPLNGYFIKAGNTSHDISLYRQSGTSETKIIDGLDERINFPIVKVKIKVTRNAAGGWQLFSDMGPSGNYSSEGSFTDNTFITSSHFGVQCTYTSTRSDKFWFDDFFVTGTTVPDTTPPVIQAMTVISQQLVSLVFSEPLEQSSAQNKGNYTFSNMESPGSAVLQSDQKTVHLNFSSSLTNGVTYLLQLSGVKDLAGNVITPSAVNVLFFHAVPVKSKDIIFTEIFPDPSPQIELPNAEFVEIYNRSPNPFNVAGWKLTDGSSVGILPSAIILPGEYWIVTSAASVNSFVGFGKTIGLSNFPTLNNDGDNLMLKNTINLTLDSLHYDLSWYRDEDKAQGGWTLELIDPANPCGEQDNWVSSEATNGGTPGKQNSVFANKPDLTPPKLLSVFPALSTRLEITFNEKLDPVSLLIDDFTIDPFELLSKVSFKDISLRTIVLELAQRLQTREAYTVEINHIRDCSGNEILTTGPNGIVSLGGILSEPFGLPEKADSMDVIVNEILFNPRSGGVDFVEVYNASTKFLNLKNWKVGNYDNKTPANVVPIFTGNLLFPPHGFAVFTSDPQIVKSQYPQSIDQCLIKTALPSLPDDLGSVIVMDDTGNILDALFYSKDWHSKFIKSDEGVTLERISTAAPTNESSSWISSSSVAGFATPGFVNSQCRQAGLPGDGEVLIVPEIFSPGTSTSDFVEIQYQFDQGGWVANVKVFDQQEHLLKIVANNETIGTDGSFRWDGDREDHTKARMGYYVVRFEVFNSEGHVKTFRKRVVVSSP